MYVKELDLFVRFACVKILFLPSLDQNVKYSIFNTIQFSAFSWECTDKIV